MKVPFQIRRRPGAHPAVAALFPAPDVAGLLDHCARTGLDPAGRVHRVAGGLLLTFLGPTDRPVPGAVRLRSLGPNLLLPVDADLFPALLDDETRLIARDRGLVFLPGGRVLAFDPKDPVAVASLLSSTPLKPREWIPLPDRPQLSDRIETILFDQPPEEADSVLDAGTGGDVGAEAPEKAKPGRSGSSRSGRSEEAGSEGERTGASQGKADQSARPDRKILARHAAALSNLLQEFRNGNIEKALRKAPPIGEAGRSRGSGLFAGDSLPEQPLTYSLGNLLNRWWGGTGGGRMASDADVLAELIREYRKAAEEATRRGDHRRAAAIYGKLLRDDSAAASALLRGGLYHDAAVFLLARLDDRRGAARAFEAAGEHDRAVELYRSVGDHEAAGDLLRRIGEEGAALMEYLTAAGRLVNSGAGFLAAGDLLLAKAGQPDLASPYYAMGWGNRPAANAISCALRLADLHAQASDAPALRTLIDEADAYFGQSPCALTEPAQFYNEIARLADRPGLETDRDELRDRALMGLAAQLRARSLRGEKASALIPTLLGTHAGWAAPLVSDASHAVEHVTSKPRPERALASGPPAQVRVKAGNVSVAAGAGESGEVFLGFDSGEVWVVRPERSEAIFVASHDLPIVSLAANPGGEHLVVLRSHSTGLGVLSSYARQPNGRYTLLTATRLSDLTNPWLTPILDSPLERLVGLWNGQTFNVLSTESLGSWGSFSLPDSGEIPHAAMLLDSKGGDDGEFGILAHDGSEWCLFDPWGGLLRTTGLTWKLASRADSVRTAPSCWGSGTDAFEFAGLAETGNLHWVRVRDGGAVANCFAKPEEVGGYLATAIVRDGLVAAVSPSRVDWLRAGDRAFKPWRTTFGGIPSAVAAFASRPTSELIVVCRDGTIVRLPIPA